MKLSLQELLVRVLCILYKQILEQLMPWRMDDGWMMDEGWRDGGMEGRTDRWTDGMKREQ